MSVTPTEEHLSKIQPLLSDPDKIRNFAVVGRIDHGRSTLIHSLLAYGGIVEEHLSRTSPGTDANASFVLEHPTGPHLGNLIKMPTYASYSGELHAALSVVDGVIFTVDVIEGQSVHANDFLRALINEPVKPVLHLNKLDRAFRELQMDSEDIYHMLARIIESSNCMFASESKDDNTYTEFTFDPLLGNVVFGSGLQGWAFTLPQFARLYASRNKIPYETFIKRLWGDHFYNSETKKFQTSDRTASGAKLRRFFCQAILDPLQAIFRAFGFAVPMGARTETQEKLLTGIGLEISDEQWKSFDSSYTRLRHVLSSWLPAGRVLAEVIVDQLPSPRAAQEYRYKSIYKGPSESEVAQAIKRCDPDGPLVVFISGKPRDLEIPSITPPYCYGRVFSGTLKVGEAIFILAPGYEPERIGEMARYIAIGVPITAIKMHTSLNSMESVDSAPAGNFVSIEGIHTHLVQTATITDSIRTHTIRSLEVYASHVVSVTIAPKDPAQLKKLTEGLRSLGKLDPLLQIRSTDDGNFEIFAAGELQLETALRDLQNLSVDATSLYSEPAVSFRETVLLTPQPSPSSFTSQSKQNMVQLSAVALPPTALPLAHSSSEDHEERLKKIVELSKGKIDLETLNRAWFFGPTHEWHNMVTLQPDSGIPSEKAVKDAVNTAFEEAIEGGVLCGEPLRNVHFNLTALSLSITSKKSTAAEASNTVRQAMLAAQLQAHPRLIEPIYKLEMEATKEHVDPITHVITKRRGSIVSSSESRYGPHAVTIIANVPVAESFGIVPEIRRATYGSSIPFLVVDHWRIIDDDPLTAGTLSNTIVKAIRARKGLPPTLPKITDFAGTN